MEKPILFNEDMVRAISDGKKTVTRRVVKPQPPNTHEYNKVKKVGPWYHIEADWHIQPRYEDHVMFTVKSPYQTGMTLWVRETWFEYKVKYYYKADGFHENLDAIFGKPFFKWRPSIHMPRKAARIFHRVKDVRAERVQDITEEDARAEGITPSVCPPYEYLAHRVAFRDLWNSIYAKPKAVCVKDEDGNRHITHYESFPFDGESRTETYKGLPHYIYANPWVWVVEFKRTPPEGVLMPGVPARE